MRSTRGFTLIELLVVIAIIGVLSSIVLSQLNNARNKGNDAVIKSDLDQARTQAELFYDANNNQYVVTPGGTTDVCSPTANVSGLKGIYSNFQNAAQATNVSQSNIITAIGTAGTLGVTAVCHACYNGEASTNCGPSAPFQPQEWAISVPLKTTTAYNYCADSTGWSGTSTDPLGAGDAHCN